MNQYPNLIGPKPENAEPWSPTPWSAEGNEVLDANGSSVLTVHRTDSDRRDNETAQMIADLANAHVGHGFGPAYSPELNRALAEALGYINIGQRGDSELVALARRVVAQRDRAIGELASLRAGLAEAVPGLGAATDAEILTAVTKLSEQTRERGPRVFRVGDPCPDDLELVRVGGAEGPHDIFERQPNDLSRWRTNPETLDTSATWEGLLAGAESQGVAVIEIPGKENR